MNKGEMLLLIQATIMMLSFSVTLLRRIEIKPKESSIYWELQAIKAP